LSGGNASAAEFTARRILMAMVRDIELSVSHVVEALVSVRKAVHTIRTAFSSITRQSWLCPSFPFSPSAPVGRGRTRSMRGCGWTRGCARSVSLALKVRSFIIPSYSILFPHRFSFLFPLHNVFLHLFDSLFILIYSTCTHITVLQESPYCIHQTHHGVSVDGLFPPSLRVRT